MMAASGCQTSIKVPILFSSMKRNNWLAHGLHQHLGQYPFATKQPHCWKTVESQNIKQYHRFSDSTLVTIWLNVFGGSGIAQWQVSCRPMLDHLDSCWPHRMFGAPNSSNCLQWRKHMNPSFKQKESFQLGVFRDLWISMHFGSSTFGGSQPWNFDNPMVPMPSFYGFKIQASEVCLRTLDTPPESSLPN